MITILNRMTYDSNLQVKIREILAAHKIDYIRNPIMVSARMYMRRSIKFMLRKRIMRIQDI